MKPLGDHPSAAFAENHGDGRVVGGNPGLIPGNPRAVDAKSSIAVLDDDAATAAKSFDELRVPAFEEPVESRAEPVESDRRARLDRCELLEDERLPERAEPLTIEIGRQLDRVEPRRRIAVPHVGIDPAGLLVGADPLPELRLRESPRGIANERFLIAQREVEHPQPAPLPAATAGRASWISAFWKARG